MKTIPEMRREICEMVNMEMDDRLVQQTHRYCRHLIQQHHAEAFANYGQEQAINDRRTGRKGKDKRYRKNFYKRRKRIREEGKVRHVH